jgi:hypothetical protein
MTTIWKRLLIAAALLWICSSISVHAYARPVDANDGTEQLASTLVRGNGELSPSTLSRQGIPTEQRNPFDKFVEAHAQTGTQGSSTLGAAPAAYPAESPGPSGWNSTHFEIEGFAQWRNIMTSGSISTANNGSISLRNDLGVGDLVPGPLIRGIWTPEFEFMGATSKFWVEYGQINRSRTQDLSRTLILGGRLYLRGSTMRTELQTKQFELGYAPRWGNSKFRIGPSFIYERLNVDFSLTDLTPGAPPPIKQAVKVPNNVFLVGFDFDYTPIKLFDIYGHAGAVPCCGGGWHVFESEFGTKYYFARNFSIMGGVRYSYLRYDFELPGISVGNVTVGPFPGSLKFPGVGPFIGGSWRF